MKKIVVALALAAAASAAPAVAMAAESASSGDVHVMAAVAGPYSSLPECKRAENRARQAGFVIEVACYPRSPQAWYFHYAR